eukprot:TRINITY_DN22065_c0_g1_i1.p1 TRINITY_DN22065_c0_g1~~TRINITY_DN22065_c0_g1_i1.p1  ORF type:complete len:385 (+),score=21.09 TRINITY_DN22065_c0_g1_i1:46-1200(+)
MNFGTPTSENENPTPPGVYGTPMSGYSFAVKKTGEKITPVWMPDVTPPMTRQNCSLPRRSMSVTRRFEEEEIIPYEVIPRIEYRKQQHHSKRLFKRFLTTVKIIIFSLVLMLGLAGYIVASTSGALRMPCSLVSGEFEKIELGEEMKKYNVGACNFRTDMETIERTAVTYLASEYILNNVHGMEKSALEDKLDSILYAVLPSPLTVPRHKFWLVFEESLEQSNYIKVPGTGSSVGLNPPPSLFSSCVLWYSRETRSQLVLNLVVTGVNFVLWKLWPPILAFVCFYQVLRVREGRRRDVSAILQCVYGELRPFGSRGTSALNLRRLVQTALQPSLSSTRISQLWPSPGFPEGPVELALLEDEDGIEYRKNALGDVVIALSGFRAM